MQQEAEYNFSKKQVAIGMVAIFAVYGTMSYFLQSLGIARPKMAADLNGLSLYSWSVSIPSLVMAFVTLIYGKLSDIYGRRIMLMISVVFCTVGTILAAFSQSFVFMIFATAVSALGTGAMMPLVFAVVGDIFPPSKRGKWIGLLNIPTGFFSLIGPMMGGWFVDNLSWRYLFWLSMPLLIVCLLTVPVGVPSIINPGIKRKVDVLGCVLVAIASSTMIIGLSFAGDKYPLGSIQIIGLLGVSLLFWILFLLAEGRVEEPILEPSVLRNRAFFTVASATFFSFFGQMGILMYFPMFLQGVQGMSATLSGSVITPFSVFMNFVGVPVGFILGRTKRFKTLYIVSLGIVTLDMFGLAFLTAQTNIYLCMLVASIAGIGLGAIPTMNTIVVQNAVPKRLLGAAMGAIFFSISMGVAISPALLGSVMSVSYSKTLQSSLPKGIERVADTSMIASLQNPQALLSEAAKSDLQKSFSAKGEEGRALFAPAIEAVRTALEASLRSVFWIGAITMLIAFLIITTIPEKSMEETPEQKPLETVAVAGK